MPSVRQCRERRARSPDELSSFFFNDTATTEIYTLSLHDALPIYERHADDERGRQLHGRDELPHHPGNTVRKRHRRRERHLQDRKSTRLNSSHANISYAVFCLKKKKIMSCSSTIPTCRTREIDTTH